MKEPPDSTADLIRACAALIAAFVPIILEWLRRKWHKTGKHGGHRQAGDEPPPPPVKPWREFVLPITLFTTSAVLLGTSAVMFIIYFKLTLAQPAPVQSTPVQLIPVQPAPVQPPPVQLIPAHPPSVQPAPSRPDRICTEAWNAYKEGETQMDHGASIDKTKPDFERALSFAQIVINDYAKQALQEQTALQAKNAPLPPVGNVPPEQRDAIYSLGLINSVATCYFIEGRSLEYLGRKDEAKVAYSAAKDFTHARTWDPDAEIFWSPSEGAAGRLETLK